MQALITAIRSRVRFIDGQVRIGRDSADVTEEQSSALTLMFGTATPTLDDVTAVTDELATGPWTQELIIAMSTRLTSSVYNPTHSRTRKSQTMKAPECISTKTDYAWLSDTDRALNTKAVAAAKRLYRRGVTSCISCSARRPA